MKIYSCIMHMLVSNFCGFLYSAMHMGFRRSPPPFLSVANKISRKSIKGLRGVNFASGGSGILDITVGV